MQAKAHQEETGFDDLVISGIGHALLAPAQEVKSIDPRPYLKQRKSRKYMSVQDELAVVATARALASAQLDSDQLGQRTGLFLVVGYIPFEESLIDEFLDGSIKHGAFNMQAFSTVTLQTVSPLFTFRCLPNMPAYHISSNFNVQGPYFVGYPGPGQFYHALQIALMAFQAGLIDRALVGGIAYQRNFLVQHHFGRLTPPTDPTTLADAAGILLFETKEAACARRVPTRGQLIDFSVSYQHHDPFERDATQSESFQHNSHQLEKLLPGDCGAASLCTGLGLLHQANQTGEIVHRVDCRDGLRATSRWRLESTSQKVATLSVTKQRPRAARATHNPQRVVVTGLGVVSPLGDSVVEFRQALLAGRSGVGTITLFDPATLRTRIAAQAKLSKWAISYRDRKIVFAVHAAEQAMAAACRCGSQPGQDAGGKQAGLSLGVGLEVFSMQDMVAYHRCGQPLPAQRKQRLSFLQTPADLCLHLISHRFGLQQAPLAHISACAAGADAIGVACQLIQTGKRRWMLAGGADSMINPLGVGGFCLLGATSSNNDHPEQASRPFDQACDGFVLGEGAAVLVLERLEDALARKAHIHAEILGWGNSLDADNISAPHRDGRGAFLAMQRALKSAQLSPAEIDCINAHATSTPLSGPSETLAIKKLLGDHAYRVPVTGNKSMTGHLISASGAVEAVAAISCMEVGQVPPTINLEHPAQDCDLDYVPCTKRAYSHQTVLSNSFGFGGMNVSLIFRRWRT